jgi:hypothetical protein
MKSMMIIVSVLLASVSLQCCETGALSFPATKSIKIDSNTGGSKGFLNLMERHNELRAEKARDAERRRLALLRGKALRKNSENAAPENNGLLSPAGDVFPFSPDNNHDDSVIDERG